MFACLGMLRVDVETKSGAQLLAAPGPPRGMRLEFLGLALRLIALSVILSPISVGNVPLRYGRTRMRRLSKSRP
jgi:hypothetical protein